MSVERATNIRRWIPGLMMVVGFVLMAGTMAFAIATHSALPSPGATPEEARRIERLTNIGASILLGGESLFLLGSLLVLVQIVAFAFRRAIQHLVETSPERTLPQ